MAVAHKRLATVAGWHIGDCRNFDELGEVECFVRVWSCAR